MKFDYFSERTVEILRNAHRLAAELHFKDVGTDHLLLAMTEDEMLFEKLGYDNFIIRREISMLLGVSDFSEEPTSYTKRAKNVIEDSVSEIDFIHHTSVEPEHILLSLTKAKDSVAIQALKNVNIDINEFKLKLTNTLTN